MEKVKEGNMERKKEKGIDWRRDMMKKKGL